MKIVEKPWGKEIWIVHTDKYAGKILKINKGQRLSLQYHKVKQETLYLDEGEIKFTLEDENGNLKDWVMKEGEAVDILPGKRHRMEALRDSKFFEVSTTELDDVVRCEDDYGRVG